MAWIFEVVEERGHGVIDLAAKRLHGGHRGGAGAVGVQIPTAIRDGDETAARFHQSAWQQHLRPSKFVVRSMLP